MDIYLLRCPSLKFLRDVSEFILFLEINYKLVFPVFSFQPSVFLRFRFYNSELWLPPPMPLPQPPFSNPTQKTACLWSQRCRDFLQMENILECLNWLMHSRLGNCSSFLSYPRMIAAVSAYSLVFLPPHHTSTVHLRNPRFLSFCFLPPHSNNSQLHLL